MENRKLPVETKKTYFNPSLEELRQWTFEMPSCKKTEFGAPNVQTKVLARSKNSTYILSDTPKNHSDQTMNLEEGLQWAKRQDEYIKNQEMIVIDGYIGNDPDFQTATRLIIEKRNANIAGMQKQLYYPRQNDSEKFEPELTVIYTPNLEAQGKPDNRLISVDLENKITRVFNSDYFGESKKGGLRMWNELVYDRGGLSLHAGAKVIPTENGDKVALIIGLSGTGKTTTTFTDQNGSRAVQDDFVALMPKGKIYSSENGCFAKTFALNPDFEPAIYNAVNDADSFLENVSQDLNGRVDYNDTSYTKNGRATFTIDKVGAADPRNVKSVDMILLLNRNENIIPAVAKLSHAQAAAYFMLGETQGTSAGGKCEEGQNLRVPGTNPFFPLLHAQQANRFKELLDSSNAQVYLLNTGRVGGKTENSKKVQINHSSAIVKALAEDTIEWKTCPDFNYEIAARVPEIEDNELLCPRRLYEGDGRVEEYNLKKEQLDLERKKYLHSWPGLEKQIIDSV